LTSCRNFRRSSRFPEKGVGVFNSFFPPEWMEPSDIMGGVRGVLVWSKLRDETVEGDGGVSSSESDGIPGSEVRKDNVLFPSIVSIRIFHRARRVDRSVGSECQVRSFKRTMLCFLQWCRSGYFTAHDKSSEFRGSKVLVVFRNQ
jgi:hypothetical protein